MTKMKRIFTAVALPAVLTLSACGGGGGSTTTTLAPGTRVSTGIYTVAFPAMGAGELSPADEIAISEFIALNESGLLPSAATRPAGGAALYQNVDGAYVRVLSGPNRGSYVADTAIIIDFDQATPTVTGAFTDLGASGVDIFMTPTTLTAGNTFTTSISGTNDPMISAGSGASGVKGSLLGPNDMLGTINGTLNGNAIEGAFTGSR